MFPAGYPDIRSRRLTLPSGLTLRVAESGALEAPAVLLLHGWGASLYMWRDWFRPLAAAGYRAIAVDLPSHGLSDRPHGGADHRLEYMVDALHELLDVIGLRTTDVVAQSMAGTIAIEMALDPASRVHRLALVNPACFGRIHMQRLGRAISPPMVDRLLPRLLARWIVARAHRLVYGDPSRVTDRDIDEYWAPSQFPWYARGMRRLLHEFPWERPPADRMAARLHHLSRPALVVLGTRDRLVRDARPYVARLTSAGAPLVVREVPGGGHAVNEERPEEVLDLTLQFLAGG